MTLVIPAEYGGCDEFGWNPASKNPVTDIAEEAYEKARGRRAVRIPISSKAGVDEESVKKYLTEDSDPLANQRFRVLAHPFATLDDGSSAAGLALGTATRPSSPEPFERDDQSDDGASISKAVSLVDHQSHVESELRRFLDRLPELAEFRETLLQAARWHDLGKADPRFQLMLYRGNAIEAAAGGLRAKSDGERADRALYNRLRAYSGYPKGGRHELLSMSIVESLQTPEEVDRDLLLHLIATHHGRCRPFAPWIKDDAPPMVSVPVDGERITRTAEHGLHEIGSGVAERFWRLTRRLQPHRLAFVESLLRLADQLASRKEREGVWKI